MIWKNFPRDGLHKFMGGLAVLLCLLKFVSGRAWRVASFSHVEGGFTHHSAELVNTSLAGINLSEERQN